MINYEIDRDNKVDRTEKLLRAFIEAQGYEITELATPTGIKHEISNCGIHKKTAQFDIDYKVTKKADVTTKGINAYLRECFNGEGDHTPIEKLIKNVLILSQLGDGFRFIKYKKYDFDRVINWFGDLAVNSSSTGGYYLILDVEIFLDEEVGDDD